MTMNPNALSAINAAINCTSRGDYATSAVLRRAAKEIERLEAVVANLHREWPAEDPSVDGKQERRG